MHQTYRQCGGPMPACVQSEFDGHCRHHSSQVGDDGPDNDDNRAGSMAYALACSESSPMACGVQTYLNNHHYNRPYTCFRPDLAGQYSLTLSATDGCVTNSATASITARCGTPPSISFTSQQAVQLSGRVFTRVALTAAVCTHVDTHAMLRHSQILKKSSPLY